MQNSALSNEKIRRKNTDQALASLALEGIYPTQEMLADLELMNTGKITNDEFLKQAFARATH